ncbi:flagellar hook-basal body complex protein FliE [Methylocystis parvus]|uniref:Flagellar hook-basal body complex protein FliE n=1 Tax=Methylocystis parvus TaxID=134 RepID=A0A6B8M6F0_9HYPH|nr:flagellar hook-basal body complex protein FliE [Methylocystis parvus]QGM97915.1 flagellar hook-basal body protein FliE [Methylocystis parvus]WBK01773.1 flagellar hook-basal body complex protein FliE [Methylocystis parvus OBBP]
MLPLAPIAAAAIGPLAETALTSVAAPRVAAGAQIAAASFGDMLQQFASGTVDSLKKSEATAIAGVEGKTSTQNIVSAVMQAERDLHTAIALRDKAVAAYQEISRMAI